MNLNIGGNLRRLRRERDLTQEELAEVLNVSFQAVSKWERGDSYPDITLLPGIASFFGVSIDDLLGMNELLRAEKIEEIHRLAARRMSEGTHEDMAAVYREGLKRFPNDESLMRGLTDALIGIRKGDAGVSRDEALEAIAVYERMLKYSSNDFYRNHARASLPGAYFLAGEREREKAAEEAQKLPSIYDTREYTLIHVTRGDDQIKAIQSLLHMFMYNFWQITRFAAPNDTYIMDTGGDFFGYTAQQRIGILDIGIRALELMSDKDDHPYLPLRISFNYRAMAELAISDGQYDQVLDYIEKAADYAQMNDAMPEEIRYSSALRNRAGTGYKEHSHGCRQLLMFLKRDCFSSLKRNERFVSVVERLMSCIT